MSKLGVDIGAWSYGACFRPGAFDRGTWIGNYVSVAGGTQRHGRNHPLERPSLHPIFYNPKLGVVSDESLEYGKLVVESDAWIGQGSVITPSVKRIGLGAVVAAGSVVTKDVADFAVVGGNPAKVIKFRFDTRLQDEIRESKWWMESIDQLAKRLDWFRSVASHDASAKV